MSRKIAFVTLCALTGATGLGASAAHAQTAAQVYAYLSPPNTQVYPGATIVPGATTETFNSLAAGATTPTKYSSYSSAIGNYSSGGSFASVTDDQYGNGTGNYFSLGAQSGSAAPVTLTFATPVTYFGLAYCAGDSNNGFSFYDGTGKYIGRYSTATLLSALQGSSVTTLDNSTYATSKYYGKPNGGGPNAANTGTNVQQPYSFVNFFPSDGTTISKIVFDNSNTTDSGFESDNHTISTDSSIHKPTSGSFVPVGASSAAPDASTLALVLTALPIAVVTRRRGGHRALESARQA